MEGSTPPLLPLTGELPPDPCGKAGGRQEEGMALTHNALRTLDYIQVKAV